MNVVGVGVNIVPVWESRNYPPGHGWNCNFGHLCFQNVSWPSLQRFFL